MNHSPSYWLARRAWAFMLWTLRRPPIKRLRRRMIERQLGGKTPYWMRIDVQDRMAMRYGPRLLVLCFGFLFYSLLFSGTYAVAVQLYDSGQLEPPEKVRAQFEPAQTTSTASEALRQ